MPTEAPKPAPDPPATPVVTRFAPSPTGELHIGGARTALYAWAFARRHGGKFLLRFEDTDRARSSEASAERILKDLDWLGLDWDNEDGQIPRQTQTHATGRYNELIDRLKAEGKAYDDGDAVRFKVGYEVTFDDAVYGTITSPAETNEDFIIRKGAAGEFMPTFHFAVTVDDADMGVTHVLRGQEHLSNTAKHAALCDALGFARPVWAHLPSIMNPGGSKMSKRDKAKAVREHLKQHPVDVKSGVWGGVSLTQDEIQDFIDKKSDGLGVTQGLAMACGIELPEVFVADFQRSGYLPEVCCNYVALLGWNPGNDLERFNNGFLAEHFGLKRINKANSTFDREKLAAFNQDTILQMSPDAWAEILHEHFAVYNGEFIEKLGDYFTTFAAMYQERSKTLSDPAVAGRFFVEAPAKYNPKAVKKNLTKNDGAGLAALAKARDALAACDPFDAATTHAALDALWPEVGGKNMGAVAQPLRVALTGNAVSPEIGPTLEVLGSDEVLRRIDACLADHATPQT